METITYRSFFEGLTEAEKDQPMQVDLTDHGMGIQPGNIKRITKNMFYLETVDNETGDELSDDDSTRVEVPKGTVLITI